MKHTFVKTFYLLTAISILACNTNNMREENKDMQVTDLGKTYEIVLDTIAGIGEGAIWDYKYNRLLWIDIPQMCLHIYTPDNGKNRTIQLDQMIGTVVPYTEDTVVVALEKGIYKLNIDTQEKQFIVNPEQEIEGNRFNDGKCDANGRLWVGTMSKSLEKGKGTLYRLGGNYECISMFDCVTISNGVTWSLDNSKMYYQDSPRRNVLAFDFDLFTGEISTPKEIIQIPDSLGDADGNTLDAEGMLWVANWGTACVTRWNPKTGEMLAKYDLPALNITSVAFGGKDLDELYVTSAQYYMPEGKDPEYPDAGKLFKIKPGVKGVKCNYFGNKNN